MSKSNTNVLNLIATFNYKKSIFYNFRDRYAWNVAVFIVSHEQTQYYQFWLIALERSTFSRIFTCTLSLVLCSSYLFTRKSLRKYRGRSDSDYIRQLHWSKPSLRTGFSFHRRYLLLQNINNEWVLSIPDGYIGNAMQIKVTVRNTYPYLDHFNYLFNKPAEVIKCYIL